MNKKIILPSLFVLNAFLVGLTPKTSKAGQIIPKYNLKTDSVSYNFDYPLPQSCNPKFAKAFAEREDSATQQQDDIKDTVSYKISWQGRAWVKYTSENGSGFIRTGGSRTWRNMNPGALRYSSFARQNGACGTAGGFAVFPTEKCGMNALRNLLQSDSYANLTIGAAIYKFAPPSDNNNTKAYQQNLARKTGLNLNKKINQLTPEELDKLLGAIKEIEAWVSGTNKYFESRNTMARAVLDNQRQHSV